MKITWIEHSSFLLELPQRVLVLDYFGKTRLPLPANKTVTFLAIITPIIMIKQFWNTARIRSGMC